MVIYTISESSNAQENSLETLNNTIIKLYKSGNYTGALQTAQQALITVENRYGQTHPYTAVVLNNLGMIYKAQAQYSQAEIYYRKALTIEVKIHGENSLEVASILNNLGV